MKPGTLESLRIEALARYFAQIGERKALKALGWRLETKPQKTMIPEIRARMRWYSQE